MPKPLTINFDTFKEMFQLENPDLHLEVDLGIEDPQIDLYHTILSGIKSTYAPHFDAKKSNVKNFKVYSGESAKLQSVTHIDFEVPSTDKSQSPQRYLATVLYALGAHPSDPKKRGIDVSFSMLGKIESSAEGNIDLEIVPAEMKCRQITGKNSNLVPVDVNFPNNVKGAVCYADAIFRCFLDGTTIDYCEIQDWLIYRDGIRRRCLILIDLLWAEAARLEDLPPDDLLNAACAKEKTGWMNRKRIYNECKRVCGGIRFYKVIYFTYFLRHSEFFKWHLLVGLSRKRLEKLNKEWTARLLQH